MLHRNLRGIWFPSRRERSEIDEKKGTVQKDQQKRVKTEEPMEFSLMASGKSTFFKAMLVLVVQFELAFSVM